MLREDVEIRAEADSLRPQLLSYIFDILVQVLQVKQNGGIKLKRLPRMADYAKHCEMIARCMGYPENTFLDAFNKNVKVQVQESVSANPVAIVLIRFMEETLKIRQILTIKAQDKDSRYNDYCSLNRCHSIKQRYRAATSMSIIMSIQYRYFQLLLFGTSVLLAGEEGIGELTAYFQLKSYFTLFI